MRLPGGPAAAVSVTALCFLTACTSPSADGESPQSSATRSPSAELGQSARAGASRPLPCREPKPAVVARAEAALAAHPGPVRATTAVRAARTGTGTWYVVGIDRAYVLDSGEPAGGASRSLGLTNATGARMIPLGEGTVRRGVQVSWQQVSWSGETLEAGRRAADRALECLDDAHPAR